MAAHKIALAHAPLFTWSNSTEAASVVLPDLVRSRSGALFRSAPELVAEFARPQRHHRQRPLRKHGVPRNQTRIARFLAHVSFLSDALLRLEFRRLDQGTRFRAHLSPATFRQRSRAIPLPRFRRVGSAAAARCANFRATFGAQAGAKAATGNRNLGPLTPGTVAAPNLLRPAVNYCSESRSSRQAAR